MTVLPKEEATDIVGKLSSEADRLSGGLARHIDGFDAIWIRQAVTEITNLRQQLEEARERNLLANNRADNAEADVAKALSALEPFARLGRLFLDPDNQATKGDERPVWGYNAVDLTYGDFRRAAVLLAPQGREG